jgi:quercetin dioxygenase-like cupin family protein
MKIIRVHETPPIEHRDAVRDVFTDCTIVRCGIAEFEPGCYAHKGEEHKHDHDEVFIILTGEITVPVTDGPSDVARAGDWVLIEAGEEHHLTNHTHLPCTGMYLILQRPEED